MGCRVGRRHNSDPVSLWLWAAAPFPPLAWKLPYATGVTLKKKKKMEKKYVGALKRKKEKKYTKQKTEKQNWEKRKKKKKS